MLIDEKKLRAEFEAMFSQPPYEWDFILFSEGSAWPGNYRHYSVQCAWEGFLAGVQLTAK